MNTMTRRAALGAVLGVALAGAAAAQEPAAFPIKKVFRFADVYQKMPAAERDRFSLAWYLEQAGNRPPPPGTKVFVLQGARRTELPLAANGRLGLPSLAMLADKSAMVTVEKGDAAAKLNMNMALEPTVRPAASLSTADLAASIEQANRGIRKAAGLVGFAVPRMGQVVFVGAGSGEAVMADGRRLPLPAASSGPAFAPARFPGAQRVVLARAPARLALGPVPKEKR